MRVLILGLDGYLGWSLAKHLAATTNHTVAGVDNYNRRDWVAGVGGHSATRLPSMSARLEAFTQAYNRSVRFYRGDLRDGEFVDEVIRSFKPDAVVHLAEQPSAPYSMMSRRACVETHDNNLNGTLNLMFALRDHAPEAHLIKLGCYDDQTEVLTERGWIFFSEMDASDRVCCLEADTEKIVYQTPTSIVSYPHAGKMLKIESKSVDCMVTPNHRVVFRRLKNNGVGEIEVEHAENLPDIDFMVPRGGAWVIPDVSTFAVPATSIRGPGGREFEQNPVPLPMDKWLAFFGLWVADGTIRRRGGRPVVVRISVKKERKVTAVRAAIRAMEVYHWTECEKPTGAVEFDISNAQLAEYLSMFGSARQKYIPRQLLTDCSARQMKILFDALVEGDGHRNDDGKAISYYSTSDRLLGDIQELSLKIGMTAQLCLYEKGERHDRYLSFGTRNIDTMIKKEKRQWVNYDGDVYCCTVPAGIIMTRRNGKVCWSGNTMGEYGTPDVDIPEGEFELEFRGRHTHATFPRRPGSFYHCTKVHDTVNVKMACRVWGLRSTDIMQGVVYGLRTEHEHENSFNPLLATRFDFDAVFGTAINRFCAQAAIDHPITVYGNGEHKRGFLPLDDAMQCLTIALDNPPTLGEYRTWNQFDRVYTINDLAKAVLGCSKSEIIYLQNPRAGGEYAGEHYYNPDRNKLTALGYEPSSSDIANDIGDMVGDLRTFCKRRIEMKRDIMMPDVQWSGARGVIR